MGGPGSFAVDLDDLDAVVADVAACERELTALADDVAREVALLHEAWSGLAADAQLAAQAEWDRGLARHARRPHPPPGRRPRRPRPLLRGGAGQRGRLVVGVLIGAV